MPATALTNLQAGGVSTFAGFQLVHHNRDSRLVAFQNRLFSPACMENALSTSWVWLMISKSTLYTADLICKTSRVFKLKSTHHIGLQTKMQLLEMKAALSRCTQEDWIKNRTTQTNMGLACQKLYLRRFLLQLARDPLQLFQPPAEQH